MSLLREKTLFVYSRCDGSRLTAPAEEEKESPAGAPVYLSLHLILPSVSSRLSSSVCFAAFVYVRNQWRVQTVGPQLSSFFSPSTGWFQCITSCSTNNLKGSVWLDLGFVFCFVFLAKA